MSPKLDLPQPRAVAEISSSTKGKLVTVGFPTGFLMFYDGKLIAVFSKLGDCLYYVGDASPAAMRFINASVPGSPHTRCGTGDFDYIVGSVLSMTGTRLVRLGSTVVSAP